MNKFIEAINDMVEFITGERPEDSKTSEWKEPKQHDFSYPITEYAIKKEKKKRKRARKADGTFRGDDKSTPNVNEAWENE